MPETTSRTIRCKWDDKTEYEFQVKYHLVSAVVPGKDKKPIIARLKDVYLGSFPDAKHYPDGVEPGALCCLKIISTDPGLLGKSARSLKDGALLPDTDPDQPEASMTLFRPSLREQYDLFPFQGKHFRTILAQNDESKAIVKTLTETNHDDPTMAHHCQKLYNCCIVEPVYEVFIRNGSQTRDDAHVFEMMTPWERLEYLRQVIEAVIELQSEENRVGGLLVLAHRDLKVDNTMIERGFDSFRVILMDTASILFENEKYQTRNADNTVEVPSGVGPHGTHSSQFCSATNTPPEQVFENWPQSEKIDVFALGGILASLFGSCTNPVYLDRNPLTAFHFLHGWPNSKDYAGRAASLPAIQSHEIETLFENAHLRYEKNRDRDRDDLPAGTSWLEEDLRAHGVSFLWGKEPTGTYDIPHHVLSKVQELFRRCTRINPHKRISLRELMDEVTALRNSVPQERNYLNEKLYRARESVHLYDLGNTGGGNIGYSIYTDQATSINRRAIRCATFNTLGGDYDQDSQVYATAFRDERALKAYVHALDPLQRSENSSVAHALVNLYFYYAEHRLTTNFDGNIRIFTNGAALNHFWDNYRGCSCSELIDDLEALLGVSITVWAYCPDGFDMPKPPDSRFQWVRTSFGARRSQHRTEPTRPTRKSVPSAEALYVCGEEGLYFLRDECKVYVGKKRR